MTAQLQREGHPVNRKRIQHICARWGFGELLQGRIHSTQSIPIPNDIFSLESVRRQDFLHPRRIFDKRTQSITSLVPLPGRIGNSVQIRSGPSTVTRETLSICHCIASGKAGRVLR